jgi:dUTP pyrophosphatase
MTVAYAPPIPLVVQLQLLPNYAGPEQPLIPARGGDAGCDLYATEDVNLAPGQQITIPTGIAMAVPPGYEAQVRPRSGLAAKHGITVVNSPGTIDSGYRGEIAVILLNTRPTISREAIDALIDVIDHSSELPHFAEIQDLWTTENTLYIRKGDRIAQLVFAKFERPIVLVTAELSSSDRGTGGLGSTGT